MVSCNDDAVVEFLSIQSSYVITMICRLLPTLRIVVEIARNGAQRRLFLYPHPLTTPVRLLVEAFKALRDVDFNAIKH